MPTSRSSLASSRSTDRWRRRNNIPEYQFKPIPPGTKPKKKDIPKIKKWERRQLKPFENVNMTLSFFWQSLHPDYYTPGVYEWMLSYNERWTPKESSVETIKNDHHREATQDEIERRRVRRLIQCAKGRYINPVPYLERKSEYRRIKECLCEKDLPCFVCGSYSRNRHHIIQLKYGGINECFNLVTLCDICHGKIHPWL